MKKQLLYFGCIGEAGHYLWYSDRSKAYGSNARIDGVNEKLLQNLDSVFPPPEIVGTGIYNDCIVPPVRIVSWWDRSVDKRPGSNSNLIGVGYASAEEMIDDAYKIFPSVMNRQERPKPSPVVVCKPCDRKTDQYRR
jgi:hypothetical protein